MKERPILFSAPMVRAILDGRKTQTRRVVKFADDSVPTEYDCHSVWRAWQGGNGPLPKGVNEYEWQDNDEIIRCPYGAPGDRLWVRETWAPLKQLGCESSIQDATYALLRDGSQKYKDGQFFAPAPRYATGAFDAIRWRPSIHMPRWASRITLEITAVRVERLQEISEADAVAEGVTQLLRNEDHTTSFRKLWTSLNGADSWASNPWVWVIEFKRIEAARAAEGVTG